MTTHTEKIMMIKKHSIIIRTIRRLAMNEMTINSNPNAVTDMNNISKIVHISVCIFPNSSPTDIVYKPLHKLSVEAATFMFVRTHTPTWSLSEKTILDE